MNELPSEINHPTCTDSDTVGELYSEIAEESEVMVRSGCDETSYDDQGDSSILDVLNQRDLKRAQGHGFPNDYRGKPTRTNLLITKTRASNLFQKKNYRTTFKQDQSMRALTGKGRVNQGLMVGTKKRGDQLRTFTTGNPRKTQKSKYTITPTSLSNKSRKAVPNGRNRGNRFGKRKQGNTLDIRASVGEKRKKRRKKKPNSRQVEKKRGSTDHSKQKKRGSNDNNSQQENRSRPQSSPHYNPYRGMPGSESRIQNNPVIENYRKGRLLGAGANGSVYISMDQVSGFFFALKEINFENLPPDVLDTKVTIIQQEIDFMKKYKHENIVQYLGAKKVGSRLHIFLEYVPGGSLHKIVQNFGRLSESVVRNYTEQILKGLAFLHDNDCVHRDIKCANILVCIDGTVRLADFGCSKEIRELKQFQTLVGTPNYMAPEVITQNGYGKKADIWSVGCSVLEMLTGRPPFSEYDTAAAVMFHIASTNDPPQYPDFISEGVRDFLGRCFVRSPPDRASTQELLEHSWVKTAQDEEDEEDDPDGPPLKRTDSMSQPKPQPPIQQRFSDEENEEDDNGPKTMEESVIDFLNDEDLNVQSGGSSSSGSKSIEREEIQRVPAKNENENKIRKNEERKEIPEPVKPPVNPLKIKTKIIKKKSQEKLKSAKEEEGGHNIGKKSPSPSPKYHTATDMKIVKSREKVKTPEKSPRKPLKMPTRSRTPPSIRKMVSPRREKVEKEKEESPPKPAAPKSKDEMASSKNFNPVEEPTNDEKDEERNADNESPGSLEYGKPRKGFDNAMDISRMLYRNVKHEQSFSQKKMNKAIAAFHKKKFSESRRNLAGFMKIGGEGVMETPMTPMSPPTPQPPEDMTGMEKLKAEEAKKMEQYRRELEQEDRVSMKKAAMKKSMMKKSASTGSPTGGGGSGFPSGGGSSSKKRNDGLSIDSRISKNNKFGFGKPKNSVKNSKYKKLNGPRFGGTGTTSRERSRMIAKMKYGKSRKKGINRMEKSTGTGGFDRFGTRPANGKKTRTRKKKKNVKRRVRPKKRGE